MDLTGIRFRLIIIKNVQTVIDLQNTKKIASGAMLAAACTVIMLLGAVLELGMYAAPLLVGLLLIPYGQKYGAKYQLVVFAAVSLLSFMLVPNIEQNLMFTGLFGWYPVLRPALQRLYKVPRLISKLLIFNMTVIAIEALVMLVLVPEAMGGILMIILLVLGNATFLLYDYIIPIMSIRLEKLRQLM